MTDHAPSLPSQSAPAVDSSTSTPNPTPMPISPTRATHLHANLSSILSRIESASCKTKPPRPKAVRLVAVSKLHPANDILALHQAPPSQPQSDHDHQQLHFGENYTQELLSKASLLPRSIRWHFIGGLQSNKCKQLASSIPNLWAVESVDTVKKANELEKGRKALLEAEEREKSNAAATSSEEETRLRVFIQINTSNETTKSGVEPGAPAIDLCRYVLKECPSLKLQGLMTIGAIARSQAAAAASAAANGSGEGEEAENEDFVTLRKVRDEVVSALKSEQKDGKGDDELELELSMGMSDDFESAIRCGSDEVRIGSTIFGQRPAKEDAKVSV